MRGSLIERLKRVQGQVYTLEMLGKTRKARKVLLGVYKSMAADLREEVKQDGKQYKQMLATFHKIRNSMGVRNAGEANREANREAMQRTRGNSVQVHLTGPSGRSRSFMFVRDTRRPSRNRGSICPVH